MSIPGFTPGGRVATFEPRWYQAEAKAALLNFIVQHPAAYDESGIIRPRNPVVAMPTGTGKSLVIADVAAAIVRTWAGCRVVMATHVKELIEQNASEMDIVWPGAPLGIYSAGLKKKSDSALRMPIIYGGIKTLINVAESIGIVHVLIIDEAHLLSDDDQSSYQKFIAILRAINPHLVVIGFTATPYRTKIGLITNNGIFTDICYDITDIDSFARLMREGYLCPLYNRKTSAYIDVHNVGIQGGDFNQAQLAKEVEGQTDTTAAMVKEFMQHAQNRTSGIFYASSIAHAEQLTQAFAWHGVTAPAVHSGLSDAENNNRIRAWKNGEVPCLTNMGKLTTGINHRPADICGMGRATLSVSLWVQMLGRFTRPSPETYKHHGLILDFARNTSNLGPINAPHIPKMKKGGAGDAPFWECPNCGHQQHAKNPYCELCGAAHDMTEKLSSVPDNADVMRSAEPIVETFEVHRVIYEKHSKEGKPDSIRVSYICGIDTFREYVTVEHDGMAGKRARDWFRRRMPAGSEPPPTTAQGLALCENGGIKEPHTIRVETNTQYPNIVGAEF